MLKWLLRILYVFLLLLVSVYVIFSAQMSRHSKYYDEHIRPIEVESEDKDDLFYTNFFNFYVNFYGYKSGTLDTTPIIEVVANEPTFSYTYRLYTFTYKTDKEEMVGYYGIFRNLVFKDDKGEKLVNPEVSFLFEFNNADFSNKVSVAPEQPSILQNSVQLILDGHIRKETDSSALLFFTNVNDKQSFSDYLTHISYSYKPNGSTENSKTFLVINHDDSVESNGYEHHPTVTYTNTPVLINGHIDGFNFNNAENMTTYGADTTAHLAYNGGVTRTIIIYSLIVIAITFLLFFRKPLQNYLANRREKKFKEENGDVLKESKVIEPIFQDVTEEDKK